MDLFDLVAKITLDSSEYEKGLTKAQGKMSTASNKIKNAFGVAAKAGLGLSAAVVAGGVAVTKMATSAADTTDHIDKMSQKIGISREAYQELDFVMSQSGTSVDKLQGGMKTLTSKMDAMASGNKDATAAFERLGVAVQNSDGTFRSQEEVFFDTVSALQGVENQTEKSRLATELFGRAGSEMMPLLNGAAGSMDEMRQKAHDLGLVLDDEAIDSGVKLTDTIDQAKRAFGAITTQIGVEFMPIVQRVLDFILENMPTIRSVMSTVFSAIGTVVEGAVDVFSKLFDFISQNVVPVLSEVWTNTIQPTIQSAFSAIQRAWNETLKPALENLWNFIVQVIVPKFEEAWPYVQGIVTKAFSAIVGFWNETLKPALGELWTFVTDTIVPKFQEAWPKIQWAAEQVFLKLKDLWDNTLKPAFEAIWVFIAETLVPKFQEYWPKVQWAVEQVFIKIKDIWSNVLKPALDEIWKFVRDTVFPKFQEYWPKIQWAVEQVFIKIKDVWDSILKPAFTALYNFVVDTLYPKFQEYWPIIQGFVTDVFDAIKKAWGNKDSGLYGVFYTISEVIKKLKNTFDTVWKREGGIGQIINDAWNTIKHKWEQSFGPVWDTISEVVSNLKETFSKVWDAIETTLTNTWNALTELYDSTIGPVFNGIADAINAAYNAALKVFGTGEGSIYATVANGVEWIKGLLNFDWSLPAPHLPSFHWDWTDYGWISIPHFWLEWNRKAYNNPFMFTKPTIMGNYGFGDGNGGEIVYGHDSLMSDIRSAISESGGNRGSFNVQINVTQLPDEDTEQFATRVSEIIAQQYDREEAVFA